MKSLKFSPGEIYVPEFKLNSDISFRVLNDVATYYKRRSFEVVSMTTKNFIPWRENIFSCQFYNLFNGNNFAKEKNIEIDQWVFFGLKNIIFNLLIREPV